MNHDEVLIRRPGTLDLFSVLMGMNLMICCVPQLGAHQLASAGELAALGAVYLVAEIFQVRHHGWALQFPRIIRGLGSGAVAWQLIVLLDTRLGAPTFVALLVAAGFLVVTAVVTGIRDIHRIMAQLEQQQ